MMQCHSPLRGSSRLPEPASQTDNLDVSSMAFWQLLEVHDAVPCRVLDGSKDIVTQLGVFSMRKVHSDFHESCSGEDVDFLHMMSEPECRVVSLMGQIKI